MRFPRNLLLTRVGTAAFTSVFFYYTFVFINLGTIFWYEASALRELLLVFLFLLSTFWVHGKIATLFNAPPFTHLPGYIKVFIEAASVIVVSLFLCLLFVYLPTFILLPDTEVLPIRVRLGFVVGAIISLFFYYFVERERKIKQLQAEHLRAEQLQKESYQAQLEALKNQVNPHFLFNSLNVLNSLIYVDQDKATQFLSQLSEVYRFLLDSSGKQLVPLKKELELVHAYIYLLKTRFGDNVQFTVKVPDAYQQLELPSTAVQMLLENAIKHNGSTPQKPLLISIFVADGKLAVKNNLQPRLDEVNSNKIGLKNIGTRYSYLTTQKVEIEQTEEAFTVRLPLLKVEQHENSDY
ncbi:sensor histidine kinase [Sabulibacter ruber]|uniref:sensor histidine kinase n=1 Tax=Sabulibacter ruber TaxID=2811901 RepID=UPI001A969B31|nr:histidine kinase [Sabulibacter ruber]